MRYREQPDSCTLAQGEHHADRSRTRAPSSRWSWSRPPAGSAPFDIYSRLLNERIVFIGQQIDDDIANLVVAQLIHLESDDPDKDIAVYVNSPGGSLHAGLAIYDAMQYVRPDVSTLCYGMAMSAASLILTGGTKGKRFSLPNSRILIHQPLAGFQGQSTDIEIHAKEMLELRRLLDEIYARHTGQSQEQVHDDMERDRFFSAQQAVDYGLIDQIISERELNRRKSGFAAACERRHRGWASSGNGASGRAPSARRYGAAIATAPSRAALGPAGGAGPGGRLRLRRRRRGRRRPRARSPRATSSRHLTALQRHRRRNDGERAAGTPGYDASVAYVAQVLRRAGWRVRVQQVPMAAWRERSPASSSLNGDPLAPQASSACRATRRPARRGDARAPSTTPASPRTSTGSPRRGRVHRLRHLLPLAQDRQRPPGGGQRAGRPDRRLAPRAWPARRWRCPGSGCRWC